MPATIKPTFMLRSSPDTCFLTLPSPFFTPSHQSLFFPTKPINLLRLIKPKPHFPSFTSFALQTSDWSQDEEKEDEKINTLTLPEMEDQESEGPTWESPGLGEPEAGVSIWEPEGGELGSVEPPEEAKVFIGNLPYEIDSERLAMLFEKAGTVEIAEVIYNRETDTSRGFGFVTMSTVEEAEKAVDTFHQFDLEGRLLTVNKAAPRGSRPERPPRVNESGYRIYVGNLPWDVDNGHLEQVFSEHGKVVNARVVFDRDTGRSRGFGFVTMSSETEMNDAIAALDGQSLEGRPIRVNIAEERPRPNF